MKSLLISIKPKWVAKILKGEKTIEVRKTMPKCDLPIDVFIYCTKSSLKVSGHLEMMKTDLSNGTTESTVLNGKVVAKFTLNEVEQIEPFEEFDSPMGLGYKLTAEKIITCQKAQLTYDEYNHYLKGKTGYAWHISNLEIFDRPKELGEFMPAKWDKCGVKDKNGLYQCNKCPYGDNSILECNYKPLTKAPQSFMFIEVEE